MSISIMEEIGQLIRTKREEKDISMEDLANIISKTRSYVNKIERGNIETPPSDDTLIKIASALNMDSKNKEKLLNLAALERTPVSVREELLELRRIIQNLEKTDEPSVLGKITSKHDSDTARMFADKIANMSPDEIEKLAKIAETIFNK